MYIIYTCHIYRYFIYIIFFICKYTHKGYPASLKMRMFSLIHVCSSFMTYIYLQSWSELLKAPVLSNSFLALVQSLIRKMF